MGDELYYDPWDSRDRRRSVPDLSSGCGMRAAVLQRKARLLGREPLEDVERR